MKALRMSGVAIAISTLDLPLVHPFRIARGEESIAHSVLLRAFWHGIEGLGEASPSSRYGETVAGVIEHFATQPPLISDPYRLESILGAHMPAAARCALDIALHDLIGKHLEKPLYALLGLDPEATPATSFTIGIADPQTTLLKVAQIAHHPILKVKLGAGTDEEQIETIALIRERYRGAIRIDANEAWTPQGAQRMLTALEPYEIEFCEQPIPAGNHAALRTLRERVRIPIIADEDARVPSDLASLYGCVDGINIKLVKCGGIRPALAMIHTARALGMRVMLGCMVESAIATTAAAHLSPLVDYADLDGPFLTSADPFTGVTYDRGKLVLPNGPGLGIVEATVVA
ncbi:MAG: dipeptide epimerase [Vulcanimicrobiaceae bacterium]